MPTFKRKVSIAIPTQHVSFIKEKAIRDDRSFAAQCRFIMKDWVESEIKKEKDKIVRKKILDKILENKMKGE